MKSVYSFKYDGLTREQAIEKLKEIELNAELTVDQKIDEFKQVAKGQIYDLIGASFCLVLKDELLCQPDNYNLLKSRVRDYSILYTPTDEELPTIVLSYDYGLHVDLLY